MRTSIYELTKDIVSPQFQYTIAKGRLYTKSQINRLFPFASNDRIDEFFRLSDKYEMINCKVVPKQDVATHEPRTK